MTLILPLLTISTLTPVGSSAAVWTAILAALAFLILVSIRRYWLQAQIDQLTANALFYCFKVKPGIGFAEKLSELWPTQWLYFELWRWDFRRYVVEQALYDEMNEWIAVQLLNDRLDEELIAEELAEKESTENDREDFRN